MCANLSFSWRSHVGSLSTIEEQKSLARDVIDTHATYNRHVHDVTVLLKMAATTAVFSRLSTSISNKLDHKSAEKPLFVFNPYYRWDP